MRSRIPQRKIYVSTQVDDSKVQILVDDEGPGVPSESFERIFEPFFRANKDGKGFGLGLAITRRCMVAHGGDATAMASPRGGLRIVLSLPNVATGTHAHAGVPLANHA